MPVDDVDAPVDEAVREVDLAGTAGHALALTHIRRIRADLELLEEFVRNDWAALHQSPDRHPHR